MIKKYLPKSEFGKNVLTLVTGTTIGQVIPIAISPVLTRLYSPEEFGFFAIFISVTAIFSVIASGRFEFAIVVVEEDEVALNLTALGITISFFLAVFTFFLVLFFHGIFAEWLGSAALSNYLFLVPVALFLNGVYQTLAQLLNRKKQYSFMSYSKITQPIAGSGVQIIFGLLNWGTGLILGNVIGILGAAGILWLKSKEYVLQSLSSFKKNTLIKTILDFSDIPKYSLLGTLINSLSFNLGSIILTAIYNPTLVGFNALIYRVLSTPAMVIGTSVSQVYAEQASVERRKTGFAKHTFQYTSKRMILLGLPIFIVLFFIIEELFAIVFGEEWRLAGYYSKFVLPLFLVRFVSTTLSVTMNIFEQWKRSLWVHTSLLLGTLIMFGAAKYGELSFEIYLALNTAILSVLYIIFYFYYRNLANTSQYHLEKSGLNENE